MAQIDPWQITHETTCYAAVNNGFGFLCGKIKGWTLYDLNNPDLCKPLDQSPSDILAAFETRRELEQWRQGLYKKPEPPTLSESIAVPKQGGQVTLSGLLDEQQPEPGEVKLKTVGTGKNKLIISQIL